MIHKNLNKYSIIDIYEDMHYRSAKTFKFSDHSLSHFPPNFRRKRLKSLK